MNRVGFNRLFGVFCNATSLFLRTLRHEPVQRSIFRRLLPEKQAAYIRIAVQLAYGKHAWTYVSAFGVESFPKGRVCE